MANATIAAPATEEVSAKHERHTRVDVIPLFGSQKLTRDGDTNSWIFSTATTKPKRLTRRESMFVNAALRAAGGK